MPAGLRTTAEIVWRWGWLRMARTMSVSYTHLPLISGVPSASSAEGQKYDMVIMQSALTMDEAGMKKTLDDLQADFQKIIDQQDKVAG